MTAVKPAAADVDGPAGDTVANSYDAIVVGGGAVGLALALALTDALGPSGRVGVVDPAANDGRKEGAAGQGDPRAREVEHRRRR